MHDDPPTYTYMRHIYQPLSHDIHTGLLLLITFGISFAHPVTGFALSAIIALVLTVNFALRTKASGKLMPAGR